MKIKTKKEMNLPELIEYIAETGYKAKSYTSIDNGAVVGVSLLKGIFINGTIFPNHTFAVDVEKEITKDTKLFLISRCIGEFGNVSYLYDRTTINSRLKNLPKDCKITHFYIENKDKELVLIWTKEKGLVE